MIQPIRQRLTRRETGSAYIVTLLALVVLTIVGLSLSLVSQTERELGVNEVNAQRAFYGANSGIGAATARALSTNNYERLTFITDRETVAGTIQRANRVRVTRFHQIDVSPANITELGVDLENVHYFLAARGQRVFWTGASDSLPDTTAESRTTQIVGEMITVQPWESSVQNMLLSQDELEEFPEG